MVEWKWIAPIEINPLKNLALAKEGGKKEVPTCHRSSNCCDTQPLQLNTLLSNLFPFFFSFLFPPPPLNAMNISVKLTESARLQI